MGCLIHKSQPCALVNHTFKPLLEMLLGAPAEKLHNSHFHASPECSRGFVVPGVHDATSNMLAFRSGFFDACSLLYVDSKLSFGPVDVNVKLLTMLGKL
jgi:hypothetical protein